MEHLTLRELEARSNENKRNLLMAEHTVNKLRTHQKNLNFAIEKKKKGKIDKRGSLLWNMYM